MRSRDGIVTSRHSLFYTLIKQLTNENIKYPKGQHLEELKVCVIIFADVPVLLIDNEHGLQRSVLNYREY